MKDGETRRIDELLRCDTASISVSSSHANDENRFTAKRATTEIGHLATLVGP